MVSSSPPVDQGVQIAGAVAAFETGGPATTRDAFADLGDALGRRELWLSMAWQDIRQRYRGSMLGRSG